MSSPRQEAKCTPAGHTLCLLGCLEWVQQVQPPNCESWQSRWRHLCCCPSCLQHHASLWKLNPEARANWVRESAPDVGLVRNVFNAWDRISPAGSAQLLSHSLSHSLSQLIAVSPQLWPQPRPLVLLYLAVISVLGSETWRLCWCLIDNFWRGRTLLVRQAAPNPLSMRMATFLWIFALPPPPCLAQAVSMAMPMPSRLLRRQL